MDAKATDYFRELLAPTFVAVRGKVFANTDAGRCRKRYKLEAPLTVDENTHNHLHFDFFPDNTESGVRDNYALAEAVRIVWREQLRAQFPRKRFRLFVSNEYCSTPTKRRPIRAQFECIDTVLRLWSLPADDPGFDSTYHPDSTGPGWVLWPEFRRDRLVKLSTVIKLIQTRAAHPAKTRYLRERWHAI